MKLNWLKQAALACSIAALLTGCAASSHQPQVNEAARIGTVGAGVTLPDLPDRCHTSFPHAALTEGAELVAILKRERAQLDGANRTIIACAEFYLQVKSELEGER